ncbi:hybrid sensor histidine kinase/response regulator [Hymenobacter ginkgonis]|uniref:hybrid sensor histidine kinase/response regulator n=1 Tax=Hymenobacter ginkgonis TaxID=2682976 RepID=UPI0018DD8555|nr:PAS domain-containing hybrid sensor histidine kinase/response regulator [Hymenobacter ginkgonis]
MRAADELVALRAKVGQLERRLREEGRLRLALRRQLARRQAVLMRLAEAVPAAIYFHNLTTGTEAFLNNQLAQALGYTPAALRLLKPRVLEALLHPHDKATLQYYFASTQQHATPIGTSTQHTVRLRTAAGEWQRAKLQHTVFLGNAQGQATCLLGSIVVAASNEAATPDLLADLSHEIKTPLHAIMGLAQLLRKGPENSAYLDALLANAENLLGITTNALQAGRTAPADAAFDAAATVQQAVQSMFFAAQAKGLDLRLELPPTPSLPLVVGNASQLRQLVVNLVGNAIKFTAVGHITVTLSVTAGQTGHVQLQLCVADTGIGISVDKLTQVFKRHEQANDDIAQHYGGTGLGLAICKGLVEQHGGRIWLESEVGQGSQFYFRLPYRMSLASPATPAVPPIVPGLLQGLRVLLVEDNEVGALLATTLLQTWQVAVEVATTGEQALALAQAKPYDLILMDVHLPQLTGIEATASLRHQPGPNQNTPVIALTAEAGVGEGEFFAATLFTSWLEKPYTEEQLHQAVATHSGRHLTPTPSKTPQYGFASLGKLAHDAGFISKMQRLFVETVPLRLGQLEATVARQDWVAARLIVHSLKTTYGSMQMEEAGQQLKKIEAVLKNNPTSNSLTTLLHFLRLSTIETTEIFKTQLATAA